MKKKKSLTVLFILVVLCIFLTGCGKKENVEYTKCCRAHSGCGVCIERKG